MSERWKDVECGFRVVAWRGIVVTYIASIRDRGMDDLGEVGWVVVLYTLMELMANPGTGSLTHPKAKCVYCSGRSPSLYDPHPLCSDGRLYVDSRIFAALMQPHAWGIDICDPLYWIHLHSLIQPHSLIYCGI